MILLNHRPMFSIILPCYNMEKFMGSCLACLHKQTFTDFEVICVDDGSTDGTSEIVASHMAEDPRIRLYRQENGGAGYARNEGYRHAGGEYVLFLDADDLYERSLLNNVYAEILKNRSDMIVYASDRIDYQTGERVVADWTISRNQLPEKRPFNYRDVQSPKFRCFIWWGWDKAYKKRLIDENRLFHQELSSTNDLFFNLTAFLCAEKISVVDKILAHHTFNNMDSVSNTRHLHPDNCLKALQQVYEYLWNRDLYEELEEDFRHYARCFINWHIKNLTKNSSHKIASMLDHKHGSYKNLSNKIYL